MSDPCLLSKWIDDNAVMIGIYVDHCIVLAKEELLF
jgi:hypothetical protein